MKTALRPYAPGAFLALAGVCMALLLSALPAQLWGWAAWALALGAAAYGNARFFAETDRRLKTCFGLLGLIFVMATALGARLNTHEETGWTALLLCAGTGLCLGPAAGEVCIGLTRLLSKEKESIRLSANRAFWLCLLLLLVCWLPVALAFFPGITGYDIDNQVLQIQTGQYLTNHPLLHTLLIAGCMHLLGNTAGYALYTGLQMAALAAAIAYAMRYLASVHCPKGLWMGLAALFALAPQHAIMAISGTKDILFAAGMLALLITWIRLYQQPNRALWAAALVNMVFVCLMRNGVLWIFLFLWLAGLFFARHTLGWRILAVGAVSLTVAFACNAAMKAVFHVPKAPATGEQLSIPCQQMARAYCLGNMDEDTKDEILQKVPYADTYIPYLADNAKSAVYFGDKPERFLSFLKLWAREGLRHPIQYIDAFLYTCKGYWDINDTSFASIYNYQSNNADGVLMLRHVPNTSIEERSLLPGLKQLWTLLFTKNQWLNLPLLWRVLHPAVYSWLAAFVLAWAVYRRQKRFILLLSLILLETLLKLLGPCCLIRYQYDLMLIAPVLLCALSARPKEEKTL